MISGTSTRLPLMLALLGALIAPLTAGSAALSEQDADALIGRLAKPAPATISFTEVRFSKLLRAPLIVSGDLGYSGPESLDRRVTAPYREQTSIRGESVKVEREGEKPRSFALKHAPELRGLLSGFSAMLAGDPVALRKTFDVEMTGNDDGWTLKLTPTDTKARRRLQQIEVNGRHSEPRCFSMTTADGASSVLLLGAASAEPVAPDVTLIALQRRCGGSGQGS
ncbi:fatty acyl CoA synthetase [Steroidobacter agaridevorans]|uniref:Fatty acyl CoA synthetase n=2 Tax=Steroidobacter agaridevorans TaxID=2695856 RepID=A0A829Y638_9GAMM|nr:fatty acyl CoA synthetase [Steroidobacter agaridevorans]